MYRIIECITQEHAYALLGVAAVVCVSGALLSVMILRRLLKAGQSRKRVQLVLSSVVMGATIWSTHFIAMLAYDPGVHHGYAPVLTGASLAFAVLGALATNMVFAYTAPRHSYLIAGALFGFTVSIMHYMGMSAYLLPGTLVWNTETVVASVLLGVTIGILAYHRVLRPVTRFCWLGGAVGLVLAICSMHFTGMSAFEIRLDSSITVPPQLISDTLLGMLVFSVVTLILFIGFTALSIETNLEREALNRLQHAVIHDHLTGLPNRMHLKEKFNETRRAIERDPMLQIAVLSLDLDLFKDVNDIHGHEVGDRVLIEVAARLRARLGPNEFVSRVGGDEFVALKTHLKSETEALMFADTLYDCFMPAIHVGHCTVAQDASLGVAIGRDADLDDLLRKSDLAMYRAKQHPDLHICQFDADMDEKQRAKLQMIHDLRMAVEGDQLELVYQLQNDTDTGEACGCEALCRWHHPDQGLISPAVFIPLAEETGLIHDIGRWVMTTACNEAATWDALWSVAVNVAPQQLAQPTFVKDLTRILTDSGLDPTRLELEVTEASVINDQAYTLKVLKQVKDLGVRIAMDDFGTGYSSLATLQAFPFDKIKIDRSFVTDLHINHKRAAIVRSTLSLGEAFRIPVLAEGVETEEELRYLNAQGCHFVQGYYFGRPMAVGDLHRLTNIRHANTG